MFKFFLILVSLWASIINSEAATCTSTTRSNYVTNQVLTSSALNTDFNQLVTKLNAFDGGCITAGTLESDSLNTTQFAPMLKGIKEGCKVSYSNASTVSIGKCLAAVNGNFVTTTAATTASFGCSGCSSETSSTTYYTYIQTGSTGSTLTPLISTTAPNEDGYDDSGNKVLASFYNNASSDIDQYSIRQWAVNQFTPIETGFSAFVSSAGVVSGENLDWINGNASVSDTSLYTFTYNVGFFTARPNCFTQFETEINTTERHIQVDSSLSNATTLVIRVVNSANVKTAEAFSVFCRKQGSDYTRARQ